MMTLPKVMDECLAVFETFRKLGFQSNDIYLTVTLPIEKGPPRTIGRTQVFVTLLQSGKRFDVEVGLVTESRNAVVAAWGEAASRWNGKMTDGERRALWEGSGIRKRAVSLISELVMKGFKTSHSLQ